MVYNQVRAPVSPVSDGLRDGTTPHPENHATHMSSAQALKALREHLNIQTSRFGPRSRFSFSSKSKERFLSSSPPRNTQTQTSAANNNNAATQQSEDKVGDLPKFENTKGKNYNAEMASQSGTGIRKPSFSSARDIDISSHRGMHIILPATASRATTSGSITDLRGCILDMSVPTLHRDQGQNQDENENDEDDETDTPKKTTKKRRLAKASPFASLAIKDISRCVIIAGRVAGPAHITGVKDSVLVVNARQVRIHECENVSVYLWAGSRPIIEDCKGMRFAEIPAHYVCLTCLFLA